ncbi:uncharacterized protein EKO05_0009069 [Ascochyta rabiei]|uniref:uncharacterized protein n=1 Tax=Didymella rabiei TaxID=5454 RepID=UPI0022066555|nr:uncharacterized protein EKO05_0009069 [Ascochyta rabiei]UPX18778.1 hypothetical protein EKO05_0009069 [Ascochyta rabiei]
MSYTRASASMLTCRVRKFFIQNVARELNLVFPTAMATAVTIRNMHAAASGTKIAGRRMKYALISFLVAMTHSVVSQYAKGILLVTARPRLYYRSALEITDDEQDWHIFGWLRSLNMVSTFAIAAESWGWVLELSPAMVGTGMIVSPNVVCSFFAGSVLVWGVMGPYLVSRGLAFGQPVSKDPYWSGLTSYTIMSDGFANAEHPSARYWLLWPGVVCMLTVAFLKLAFQGRVLWNLLRTSAVASIPVIARLIGRTQYDYTRLESGNGNETEDEETPCSEKNEAFSLTAWGSSLLFVIVAACILTKSQFQMSILETVVALVLAFLMSLITIQATGATGEQLSTLYEQLKADLCKDTTPITTVSKVSQVTLGAMARASGSSVQETERINLIGGALTSMGANHATDLISDFRVGFLLRTPPGPQFLAQIIGM